MARLAIAFLGGEVLEGRAESCPPTRKWPPFPRRIIYAHPAEVLAVQAQKRRGFAPRQQKLFALAPPLVVSLLQPTIRVERTAKYWEFTALTVVYHGGYGLQHLHIARGYGEI